MPKSFFGCNSASCGPIYFKYSVPQCSSSGRVWLLCLALLSFLLLCILTFLNSRLLLSVACLLKLKA